MVDLTILRTAVGSLPSRGLIDALHEYGFRVIGADTNPAAYGHLYLKESAVVPRGDKPGFADAVADLAAEYNIDAVLAGPEAELLTLSGEKARLGEQGTTVLCPDAETVEVCATKRKTHKVFVDAGIPVPDLYDYDTVEFPCIVKPQSGGGSTGVNVARSETELGLYANNLDDPIFQEYIEGPEYTVDVLSGKNGRPLSVVPRRRHDIESGKSVTSETVARKEIVEYCECISRELDLFGPSCIQCIDGSDGLRFIEVNTRFGGGAILSVQADDSIIANLERLIRGERGVKSDGFQDGLVMTRNYTELYADRTEVWDDNA
jgi:carbamoyl-phosphate synthase large subunit